MQRLLAAPLRRRSTAGGTQNSIEKSGESRVQFFASQRRKMLATRHPCVDQTRVSQHPEVVRHCRLALLLAADKLAAGHLPVLSELPDNR